jgi:hypothetical protein
MSSTHFIFFFHSKNIYIEFSINSGFLLEIKTNKIVSMKVTKEKVSDSKMLKTLIQQQQQQNIICILIAECAIDFKDNFSYLDSLVLNR